jgi:hypothetical protein
MSKMIKSKLVSLLVLPLLLFSLVGQGIASTLVLCIGESGHVAIEMEQNCTEGFAQEPGLMNRDSLVLSLERTSFQKAESSCFDIPLLMGSSDPNISSVQYSYSIQNMIDRASNSLLFPSCPILEERFFPKTPFFRLSALSALKSTVLLI